MRKLLVFVLALIVIGTAWAQNYSTSTDESVLLAPGTFWADDLITIAPSGVYSPPITSIHIDLEYMNEQSKDFGLDLEGTGVLVIRRDGEEVIRIYSGSDMTVVIDKGCTGSGCTVSEDLGELLTLICPVEGTD